MKSPLSFFQWGAGGKAMTPEELQRMRLVEAQIAAGDRRPADTPIQGIARVAEALAGSIRRGQLDERERELKEYDRGLIASFGGGFNPVSGAAIPVDVQPSQATSGITSDKRGAYYEPFMNAIRQRVRNPYGLAAIAATGQAESGFAPGNANRVWSDPSQSGQAGQSGGLMSWRNERLRNMMNYAAQNGEDPGAVSPETQAQFFLNEDPKLIERLNNAGSVEEAQGLMNNAWRFAGYNRPGGEADRRLQVARALLPQFQGGQQQSQASQGGYNTQALLDASVDPMASENTRRVAQALLKQQQAQDAAAMQIQQRQQAAISAGIDPRYAADEELWKQAAAAQFRQDNRGPSAVDQRIERLTDNIMQTGGAVDQNEARNIAIGIVDGRLRADRHPTTGAVQVVDMATGMPVTNRAQQSAQLPDAATPARINSVDAFGKQYPASNSAFGIEGAIADYVNMATDAVGIGPAFPEVQSTQSDFAVLREALLGDISGSYGRQPPSWLLKSIQNLIPEAGSPIEGRGAAISKLKSLGRNFNAELQTVNKSLGRELTPANRQTLEAHKSGLEQAISRLDVAIDSFGASPSKQDSDAEINAILEMYK